MRVDRVGHVGLRVPDLDASVAFAEQFIGLREVERIDGTAYLTCNERHHELVLVEGGPVGCDHLGFETFAEGGVETMRGELARRGIGILAAEPLEAGVRDAVRFNGPGGFVFEVFEGMATDQPARYATTGVAPRKFEHITLKSSRKAEMESFLIEVFGLRLSDRAEDAISWLRVSEEHHGVSVIADTVDQLQHYAWQVECFDEFRRIGDRLLADDRTLLWGPGHHGIGDNYFCYFLDADGALVEYSSGIARIEDELAYEAKVWPDEPLSVNRWGNPPPPEEFIQAGTPLVVRDGEAVVQTPSARSEQG